MSSAIMQMLASQLDKQAIKQISSQLGADDETTQQAIGAALPMLLGAMDRNTNSTAGAQALAGALLRDHDGSILKDVAGALSKQETQQDGEAILGHLLGTKRDNVETGLSKATGLDLGSASQLLPLLAPLVMGAVGKKQREENLDADQVSNLLTKERQEAEPALGGLAQLLDLDGDGDVTDEMIGLGSNLLKNFLGDKR